MIEELIHSKVVTVVGLVFGVCYGLWMVFVQTGKMEKKIINGEKLFVPKENLPWFRRLGWALIIFCGGGLLLSFFV